MYTVLTVCLGNICRSPLAQGVIEHLSEGLPIRVDSAGTSSYHIGAPPDHRSQEVALSNGFDISRQRARKIVADDLQFFDYILAMDRENYQAVLRLARTEAERNKVILFLEAYGGGDVDEVPDPYYGTLDDFQYVFRLLNEAAGNFINELNPSHGAGQP